MSMGSFDLDEILDLPRWQKLQDKLACMTNMAIITVDYKGTPITQHSMCCPFCQSVRANPQLSKYCQICDSRGGLEAVRSQKPYIYLCHFNIIDIAIPITVDDKYLGAIMAGQIRLDGSADLESFECLLSSAKNAVATQHLNAHIEAYQAIPQLPFQQVLRSTEALYELIHYIVESSAGKVRLLEAYDAFYSSTHQAVRRPAEDSGNYLKVTRSGRIRTGASLLEPALQYIQENRDQPVTQGQMAQLCHLSSGYFSRLFTQEMGCSFSQYLTAQKLVWAKQLLEDTEQSVERISETLGFSSSAYFIKVFKKHEGITPLLYRKYHERINR